MCMCVQMPAGSEYRRSATWQSGSTYTHVILVRVACGSYLHADGHLLNLLATPVTLCKGWQNGSRFNTCAL